MERVDDKHLILESVKSNFLIYIIASTVIMVFELIMLIRGLLIPNASMRLEMYRAAYLFLFLISLGGLITFSLYFYKGKMEKFLVPIVMAYCAGIALWSGWISALDISYGNSMIVYYTVIMAMAGLVLIPPMVEGVIILGSLLVMVALGYSLDFTLFESFGDVFNLIVFSTFSFLVSLRHYTVEKKEFLLREKLKKLSFMDELTGLQNRRSFDIEITYAVEKQQDFIMMLIDVDNFKKINDTHGHAIGDYALRKVSDLLKEAYGEKVYRYGGDEMAVICYDINKNMKEIIDRINVKLKDPDMPCPMGISAGYYTMKTGDKIDEVISRADDGLYMAKENGRGRAMEYRLSA